MKTDLAKKVTLSILMGSMLFANSYVLAAEDHFGENASETTTGVVKGNKLTISESDNYHDVYAAVTGGANAEKNVVTMEGGTVEYVGGAATDYGDGEDGSAIENGVIMSGGTAKEVVGGEAYGEGAKVEGNYVNMSGGTAQNVYGANTLYATATGNKVTISGDAVVTGSGNDGYEDEGVTTKNLGVYGVISGIKDSAEYNTELGQLKGNSVEIKDNAKVSNVYGAYSYGDSDVIENVVTINGNTVVGQFMGAENNEYNGLVVGGFTQNGNAEGNSVVINGTGTIEAKGYGIKNVYGAHTGLGEATNNKIEINSGTVGEAYAAVTGGGNAEGNIATMTGGTVDYLGGAATDYGDGKGGSAIDNGVEMSGGTAKEVVGGEAYDKGAKVEGNYVNMSGGEAQNVYGANTLYATATGNTVTISGTAKVTGSGNDGYEDEGEKTTNNGVYGAFGAADTDNADAELATLTNNTVNITGGEVASAFGAFSEGNGDVSYNKVNVTGGTTGVVAEGNDRNELAGGYSVKGDVIGNAVEITAGEVNNEEINGGKSEEGNANQNSVSITGGEITTSLINGGYADSGTANENRVTIENVNIKDMENDGIDIYGGLATEGTVSGNKVTINDLSIERDTSDGHTEDIIAAGANGFDQSDADADGGAGKVAPVSNNTLKITGNLSGTNLHLYGGYIDYANGDAVGNVVEIGSAGGEKTTITSAGKEVGNLDNGAIFAGYSEGAGKASDNTVSIVNADVTIGEITGGYSETGIVENNKVAIKDSTTSAKFLYGGYSADNGSVTGNTVEVSNVTFNHPDAVAQNGIYGGYSYNGDVSGNNVVISGKVTAEGDNYLDVYAGYSVNGKNENNKITLLSGADVSKANLHGSPENAENNTNELVIGEGVGNNSWSGTVNSISNFSRIAFANVKWEDKGTILTITDTKNSNLEGTVIDADGVNFDATSDVNVGESMTFLAAADSEQPIEGVKYEFGKYTVGTMYEGTMDGNSETGVATVQTQQVATQNNLLAENRAVAAAFVNQGTDLISDSLDVLSRDGNYGVKTFAAVYGNRSKYDVNSDLKINGWSVIAGVGSEKALKNGDFSWGVFYENGSGNYRTYNEFNNEFFRGDGSVVYNGGGIAARYEQNNGVYTEASLRAGMLKSEMDNAVKDGAGNTYGYDSDTTYYGAHLGIGKIISLNESSDLDIYGKFFHTYNDGDTVTIGNGNKYEFDSITSDRLRLGARITTNKENKFSTYYGLAYEYEFNGDADMRVGKLNAETQSLQGSSYMAEIGMNYQPSPDSPWSFDLNMRGYTGERQGESFNVQATYTF